MSRETFVGPSVFLAAVVAVAALAVPDRAYAQAGPPCCDGIYVSHFGATGNGIPNNDEASIQLWIDLKCIDTGGVPCKFRIVRSIHTWEPVNNKWNHNPVHSSSEDKTLLCSEGTIDPVTWVAWHSGYTGLTENKYKFEWDLYFDDHCDGDYDSVLASDFYVVVEP